MILMHARGSKFCQVSSKEGRVNRPFNVKSDPLTKEGDFRVNLKYMPPLVNDLTCRKNLVNQVHQNEVEHNMCLTLGKIGSILYASNIIHTLNSFTVQFIGPSNNKVIVNGFQSPPTTRRWNEGGSSYVPKPWSLKNP